MNRLAMQMRVIAALMMRETVTRFGASSGGYLWALVEPVAVIALLVAVFSQIAQTPPAGQSFALFYATGYMAFFIWNDIAATTGRSVQVNRPLLAYPAVTPLDTVLARFILQALTGGVVTIVVLGGTMVVFGDPVQIDPGPVMAAFALAALLGLGTGLVNTVLFSLSRSWEIAWGIVSRPLFLVSGVFFSFAAMPVHVRDVLWYNPLIHLVELMRAGFYPAYDTGHVSIAYVGFTGIALVLAGLGGMRRFPHRLVEG